MVEVFTTEDFDRWLRKLKDRQGRLRILSRIDRLAQDNSGDVKTVGQGVLELRLTYGPGYRIYYARRGDRVVLKTSDGEVMVKELKRRTTKTLELQSLNPAQADRTLDADDVAWIARIVWASQ